MSENKMKYLKNSNVNVIIPSFLLALIFSIVLTFNAFAMGISISFADVNASVGDEVNLVMTLSSSDGNIDSATVMLSYDDSVLDFVGGTNAQGGAGSIKVTSNTGTNSSSQNYSLKFKAKAAKDTTVVVSSWEVYDTNAKMATMQSQGSGKIKIKEAEAAPSTTVESTAEKSKEESTTAAADKKDASLSSLKVSPGKLNPDFKSNVKNYDMNVAGNISNIAVSAKPRQDGSKVVITGNDNLVVGVNAVAVKVTSPDGSVVESYIINVKKSEMKKTQEESTTAGESVIAESEGESEESMDIVSTANGLTIGGIDYQVSDSFDKNILPEGFEESTFTYKGREVKAGKMKNQDVYILYLVGNDGSGDFYIYDDASDKWSVYTQIDTNAKSITVMPLDKGVEVPKGFVESILVINGKKIRGWIWGSDNEKRYCVVYAMNSDGRKDFYRYDMEEGTIQRYFVDPNADTGVSKAEYDVLEKKYERSNEWLRNVIALAIILAVFVIILLISKASNKKKAKKVSKKVTKKKNKSNITKNVDLISEKDQDDKAPLEYMPLGQKKEEVKEAKESQPDTDDGFAEVDISDGTDESHDTKDEQKEEIKFEQNDKASNEEQKKKDSDDFEDVDV